MSKKAIEPTKKQIAEWKEKAEKWDALDEKIGKLYFDEDGNEIPDEEITTDLGDIGEIAARACGYM